MKVELLQNTELHICAQAVRTCWQSQEKSDTVKHEVDFALDDVADFHLDGRVLKCGENDKALIERVGNKFKHASTLEHLTYTFYISGVSRALLQELARHRMASPSVKSTRYTLKELKDEADIDISMYKTFDDIPAEPLNRCCKYLVWTFNEDVDFASIHALSNLQKVLKAGVSNDKAKFCLPESYKTELTWTINARSLQNFISLRSSKAALWEIRDLATMVYENLPEEHKYLFTHCLSED